MSAIPVKYDDFDLQLSPYKVTRIDAYSAAPRTLQNEQLAKRDGGITVYSRYESKNILIEGQIKTQTQSSLELAIDTLTTALNKFERKLEIGYAGGTRTYITTQNNIQITRDRGGSTYANFSIEFLSPQPFGLNETSINFINTTITLGSISVSINNQGSYKAEPVLSVTLTSFTGAGERFITIGNPVLAQRVTITNEFEEGDTITIDCFNKDVFLNGSLVEYRGKIPEWAPGVGSIEWVDSFTARSVNIQATYQRKYL
jgi:phage-related protein